MALSDLEAYWADNTPSVLRADAYAPSYIRAMHMAREVRLRKHVWDLLRGESHWIVFRDGVRLTTLGEATRLISEMDALQHAAAMEPMPGNWIWVSDKLIKECACKGLSSR